MCKNSSKVSNKNKQRMLIFNLKVDIYKFQTHFSNWYMRRSKKLAIRLNSPKMEDQDVCFHKNLAICWTIKYFILKIYFFLNDGCNVLSASVSFWCVLGQIFFSKSQVIGQGHGMSHWSRRDSSTGSVCISRQILFFLFLSTCLSRYFFDTIAQP